MAYQKKYYFSFKQLGTDDVNLVEIWQDTTDVLTAEEVTGLSSPFISELSELDHKFQPVIGQGCEIGLLSTTDRKFFDGLYHVDSKEFMIYHYINSSINYIGYLTSEMYLESYDSSENYGTSITGNDGLAISDRFTFVDDSGDKYSGEMSEFDILAICLNKIGLPWDEIRICLSTTFADFSGDVDSTILHETYISTSNFYDEDDAPMTIREVMESILQPYGAQLFCEGGNVYIVDINSRTKGIEDNFVTIPTFQRFNYSDLVYISDISISINKTIQEIGYSGTGQSIELSGGVNKQVVAYSPYPTAGIIENVLTGLTEFTGIPSTWVARQDYFYKILTGNDTLNLLVDSSIANFESSYYDGTVSGESVQNNYDGYLNYKFNNSYVNISELGAPQTVSISGKKTITIGEEEGGTGIKIAFDFLSTFEDSKVYRYQVLGGGSWIGFRLYFQIKIGDYYYDGINKVWTADSSNTFYKDYVSLQRETWTNTEIIVPVYTEFENQLLAGDLNFYFTSRIEVVVFDRNTGISDWQDIYPAYDRLAMVWIKNLSIDVTNVDTTAISENDVEYVGILDEKFKEEGEQITVTTGTDTYSSDRAKMMYKDSGEYKSIQEWTRESQTFKIEELLLNSLVSNYRFGFIKLNNLHLKQGFSILNVITDNNILDKVFMLKSVKFDYEMNDLECSLWETSPDSLTIIK